MVRVGVVPRGLLRPLVLVRHVSAADRLSRAICIYMVDGLLCFAKQL